MKTLGILFTLLSIINIPVFIMYSAAKQELPLSLLSIESITDNFCLGNIDHEVHLCRHSHLSYTSAKAILPTLP